MELVPGQTLRRWMTGREVPGGEILTIAQQIAEGLAELHGAGVFHRDLKPGERDGHREGRYPPPSTSAWRATRPWATWGKATPPAGASAGSNSSAYAGTFGLHGPGAVRRGHPRRVTRRRVFALGVIALRARHRRPPLPRRSARRRPRCDAPHDTRFRRRGMGARAADLAVAAARLLERRPSDQGFANGAEVLAALGAIAADRVVVVPREAAADIGELPTQLAPVPPRRRTRTWISLGAAAAIGASLIAARAAVAPAVQQAGARVPGMALIDVGTITVGRSAAELDRECAAIGPGCKRLAMAFEEPSRRITVPRFQPRRVRGHQRGAGSRSSSSRCGVPVRRRGRRRSLSLLRPLEQGPRPRPGDPRGSAPAARRHRVPRRSLVPRARRAGAIAGDAGHLVRRALVLPGARQGPAHGRRVGGRRPRPGGPPLPLGQGRGALRPGGGALRDGLIRMPAECPEEVSLGPVGEAAQDITPEGIHDLGGNAAEWVDAVFAAGSRGAPEGPGAGDLQAELARRLVGGLVHGPHQRARGPSARRRASATTWASAARFDEPR